MRTKNTNNARKKLKQPDVRVEDLDKFFGTTAKALAFASMPQPRSDEQEILDWMDMAIELLACKSLREWVAARAGRRFTDVISLRWLGEKSVMLTWDCRVADTIPWFACGRMQTISQELIWLARKQLGLGIIISFSMQGLKQRYYWTGRKKQVQKRAALAGHA
jgi:hypothetical protein